MATVRPFTASDAPLIAAATRDVDILRWTLTDEAMPAERIERWLADEPVTAYQEPALARLARWGRRHEASSLG